MRWFKKLLLETDDLIGIFDAGCRISEIRKHFLLVICFCKIDWKQWMMAYEDHEEQIAQQAIIANHSSCLSKHNFLPAWSAELSAVCPCSACCSAVCASSRIQPPAPTTKLRLSPFDSSDSFNLSRAALEIFTYAATRTPS